MGPFLTSLRLHRGDVSPWPARLETVSFEPRGARRANGLAEVDLSESTSSSGWGPRAAPVLLDSHRSGRWPRKMPRRRAGGSSPNKAST